MTANCEDFIQECTTVTSYLIESFFHQLFFNDRESDSATNSGVQLEDECLSGIFRDPQ